MSKFPEDIGLDEMVYIAGPMRGYQEFNFPAFFRAEKIVGGMGFLFFNPAQCDKAYGFNEKADHNPEELEDLVAKQFFPRDIKGLLGCGAVALLPGWEKSRGAKLEVALAQMLKLPLYRFCDWHKPDNEVWLAKYENLTIADIHYSETLIPHVTYPSPGEEKPNNPLVKKIDEVLAANLAKAHEAKRYQLTSKDEGRTFQQPEEGSAHDTTQTQEKPSTESILEEAQKIVDGARRSSYGHPTEDFYRTTDFWNTYLKKKLKPDSVDCPNCGDEVVLEDGPGWLMPEDLAIMMILLKISRQSHKHKRDNLVDIAGYTYCIEKLEEEVGE